MPPSRPVGNAAARAPDDGAQEPQAAGVRGQRTRDALLAAARAAAAEEGWHAVTVRRVAERAGCSPALVYEYFAGKDALLLELVRDGFRLLSARVEAARAGARQDDPLATAAAAFAAMARAYWAFARDHTDLYQVMYGLGGTRFPATATWTEGAAVGEAFVPVVAALSGADATRPDVARRVYTLWATVHGLVALVLAGRMDGGWPSGESLLAATVDDALAAWSAAVPALPVPLGSATP